MRHSLPSSHLFPDLIDVLDRIRERIETFVAILSDEETAIRRLSFDGLTKINLSKHLLLEEIRQLEEQRAAIIGRMADEWLVPPHALRLADIAQRAGQEDASRLRQLQHRLTEITVTAQERNRYLALLVARSIEFFRESLRICQPSAKEMLLYSSSGVLQSAVVETGFIERRE